MEFLNIMRERPEVAPDMQLFVDPQPGHNANYSRTLAVASLIGQLSPDVRVIEIAARSKDGSMYLAGSVAAFFTANPLCYEILVAHPFGLHTNILTVGEVWKRLMSGSDSDPAMRLAKVLADIFGQNQDNGEKYVSDNEALMLCQPIRMAASKAAGDLIADCVAAAARPLPIIK